MFLDASNDRTSESCRTLLPRRRCMAWRQRLGIVWHGRLDVAVRRRPGAGRGITLVEMLISMAVTLVMMAAVVNLFANIGSGVRVRRASMELGGQLRMVRARLFKDLAGATCAARPKLPSDDHDDGYLEIVEGQWSDKAPSGLVDVTLINTEFGLDSSASLIPRDNNGQLIQWDDANGNGVFDSGETYLGGRSALGDYDDVLALTVRSESEPFVGRRTVLRPGGVASNPADWIQETIESHLAEVIWYAVEAPADAINSEPGMRTIYRRVLLIAPWVEPIDLTAIATTGGGAVFADNANRFYQRYDISARYDAVSGTWIPNTLSDLTRRENRFAHLSDLSNTRGFPHQLRLTRLRDFSAAGSNDPSPLHPFGAEWVTPDPALDDPDREGDDVMLNDVLAFDLRVYDPGAPLFENFGQVMEPSDAGWNTAPSNDLVGVGAYCDLFWNHTSPTWQSITQKSWTTPLGAPRPLFANAPAAKSRLDFSAPTSARDQLLASVTYDTWPYHYESDLIDQNLDGNFDEGTDGVDLQTDNNLIVDDAEERETAPPYDSPLRGIQVKLRIYDRDSRQIREATVTRNFVPQ